MCLLRCFCLAFGCARSTATATAAAASAPAFCPGVAGFFVGCIAWFAGGFGLGCDECCFAGAAIPFGGWTRLALGMVLPLAIARAIMAHFTGWLVGAAGRGFFEFVGFFLVFEFEEVGDIQERVALEANVDEMPTACLAAPV